MTKRKKKLSAKAKENEISIRKQNIESNIRKFNKILKSSSKLTPEKQSELTDVYLDATADLEIICGLENGFSDDYLNEQISLMEKYLDAAKSTADRSHVSQHSGKSKSSVQIAIAQIQSEEIEAEIQSLRRQAEDEQKLRELEEQIRAQKLRMQTNALADKKHKLQTRRRVLEERDLDEREDIAHALDSGPMLGEKSPHSIHETSVAAPQPPASAPQPPASQSSNASDMHILADSIAKAMQNTRIPIPEPPIFSGNPLEYVDWEVSFRTLIDNSGIPDSDKIHYLKRYVAGPAKEAISGSFLLSSSAAYATAKRKLKERFGSNFAVAEAFRSKLQQWPKIKANETVHIQRLADFLSQCETAMDQIEELKILNDSQQNIMLMNKLPDWLEMHGCTIQKVRWKISTVLYVCSICQ